MKTRKEYTPNKIDKWECNICTGSHDEYSDAENCCKKRTKCKHQNKKVWEEFSIMHPLDGFKVKRGECKDCGTLLLKEEFESKIKTNEKLWMLWGINASINSIFALILGGTGWINCAIQLWIVTLFLFMNKEKF